MRKVSKKRGWQTRCNCGSMWAIGRLLW